jgi:hypothetical protein
MGDGRMITVNLTKAKEIKKDIVRAERAPLLQALDIELMKNITDPVKVAEIEAKKQTLRDATAHASIVEATTVEELKAANPLEV